MTEENMLHESIIIVNTKTGEIGYMTNKEYKDYLESKGNHVKGTGYLNDKVGFSNKNSNLFKQYIFETFGAFYFFNYNKTLEYKHLFRFSYLCTYINYKGFVEFGNAKGLSKLATLKDCEEILKLKPRETRYTMKYFIENNFLEITKEKYLKINNKLCNRGKVIAKRGIVRMFDSTVQEIYNKATPQEHSKLDLLIKILPYVHFHTNILCENPDEDNLELIKALKMKDLCIALGYNITNSTRLKKQLLDLSVHGELVIGMFENRNGNFIVVNPCIFYKGNSLETMQGLSNLFKVKGN